MCAVRWKSDVNDQPWSLVKVGFAGSFSWRANVCACIEISAVVLQLRVVKLVEGKYRFLVVRSVIIHCYVRDIMVRRFFGMGWFGDGRSWLRTGTKWLVQGSRITNSSIKVMECFDWLSNFEPTFILFSTVLGKKKIV